VHLAAYTCVNKTEVFVESLLTAQEVADILRVSLRKLEQMVAAGTAPQHYRIGRLRRWSVDEVEQWLEDRLRSKGQPHQEGEEED
jgi:excisionase family DNA binding protein